MGSKNLKAIAVEAKPKPHCSIRAFGETLKLAYKELKRIHDLKVLNLWERWNACPLRNQERFLPIIGRRFREKSGITPWERLRADFLVKDLPVHPVVLYGALNSTS
jgi:aldehyde:ferredoxin oxidoreductase